MPLQNNRQNTKYFLAKQSTLKWITIFFGLIVLSVYAYSLILQKHKTTNLVQNVSHDRSNNLSTNVNQKYHSSINNTNDNGKLEPTIVGGTECGTGTLNDHSYYAQVAISNGVNCQTAELVINAASGNNGGNYSYLNFSCTSNKQGSGTIWSSYWNNNFYSYNCTNGMEQVAFNYQTQNQASSE